MSTEQITLKGISSMATRQLLAQLTEQYERDTGQRVAFESVGGVNAEIFNPIAQRFKNEAPYKHSMMVTLTNGTANSGYVPNDAAFGYNTFEVLSSRLQPGCAEKSIVNGLLQLMDVTSGGQH